MFLLLLWMLLYLFCFLFLQWYKFLWSLIKKNHRHFNKKSLSWPLISQMEIDIHILLNFSNLWTFLKQKQNLSQLCRTSDFVWILCLTPVLRFPFLQHQRSSFLEGCLPSKVVFHQRSSSIQVRLYTKILSKNDIWELKEFLGARAPLQLLPVKKKKNTKKFQNISYLLYLAN